MWQFFQNPRTPPARRSGYRPQVEALEDRLALSFAVLPRPAVAVASAVARHAQPVPAVIPTPALPTAAKAADAVPDARYARLAHTINISLWFRFPEQQTPTYYLTHITDGDLQLLRSRGFTSVRLAIEPRFLYRPSRPGRPKAAVLAYVDQAVNRILAHDLGVIVDMHDEEKTPFEEDRAYANGFVKFWKALAQHFSGFDPERVFLEALNEPVFSDRPGAWLRYQRRLLGAMRAGAPQHTLIATGPFFSSLDGLLRVLPVADPNVLYTFHFYEPFPFTHQGATFVDKPYRFLRDLPYPSSPEAVAAVLPGIGSARARAIAQQYGAERWDAARVAGRIAVAAAWAQAHGVRLVVGEFGVFCATAPYPDKLQYLRDVRTAFEQQGIAWALWSYEECFGLNRSVSAQGQVSVDEGVVGALGLLTP